MGLKIIDKMGWYWIFFQKASVFSALQVYLDFINLFLYIIRLMNWNRKWEKIFQENRSSFARIKISGILRKTEYAKMKCRNGGKLCSGIIVFFCLKILFLAWTASFF